MDHAVWLDTRRAEQHQEVASGRISDPWHRAEGELDHCRIPRGDVARDVDALLAERPGRLPAAAAFDRPNGAVTGRRGATW
jgi:hypothetical protein